jgi:hypothetical protein
MAIKGAVHGVRTRGSFNVDVKLDGNWVKFNQLVGSLDTTLMTSATMAQLAFAEKYRDRVQTNIRTGGKRFGYPGHSPKYAKYKSRHSGGTRLLYWGGTMADSVEVMELSGGRVGVGIPKEAVREPYHDKEGDLLTVSEYANILEHGAYSRGIPERPVFSDTCRIDMKGIKGLQSFIQWHIVRNFGAQGVHVNKI